MFFKIKNNGDVSCTGTLTAGNTNINGSIQCSGNLQTGNTIAIKGTSEGDLATLYLATPYTVDSAYKCALIAQGMTNYSRSKLHFCLNNAADNTYPTQNASLSNSKMTIDYTGNVSCTGTLTASKYYVNGENYSFNSNWNGTGASGWFVPLNQYWYTGHAYLTVAIHAKNVAGSIAYCCS